MLTRHHSDHNHPSEKINITYQGRSVILRDAFNGTPLYSVRVCHEAPQMLMTRLGEGERNASEICSATFHGKNLDVGLIVHGRGIRLQRHTDYHTTYFFRSVDRGSKLIWEGESALSGGFTLADENGEALARYHSKAFSRREVGVFEIMGGSVSEQLKGEIVISGLAMLAMVQSHGLSEMVLTGECP